MTRIGFFYLLSFGTSLLGNSITAIALPLLVLFTTGSPLGAGVVAIAAAVLTLGVPAQASVLPEESPQETRHKTPGSVFSGLVIILRSPLLRMMVLLGLALGTVLAATQGMVIPVHFAFGGQPQFVGFVLSALAAGLLVGGALFAGLSSRLPRRSWFFAGVSVIAVGFVVIAVLGPVWSIFVGAGLVGFGGGAVNAVVGLTFVENVDDDKRGKVLGAQNALLTVVPAAGIGGASLLIEWGSLQVAAIVLAVLWVVSAAAVLLSPQIRLLGSEGT